MKLQQGQLWKGAEATIRIVKLERMAVEYKIVPELESATESQRIRLTKKEFCRLIKGSQLTLPTA